ncbi:MAG TPA: hypothetical protein DDW67_02165 [Elusimicrobia bacterium]|nr:hypothetical protein [Elusimicrobiota bacterium]
MVITFLIMGGGVFGFLIWNGLQDMQDVKFRSFGSGITGRATLPILKYFGFVDNETPEGAAKAEMALKIEEVLKADPSAAAVVPGNTAASPARPSRPSYGGGPSSKIQSSLSGAGGLGGSGGSKSFSSFSGSEGSGGLKLSGQAGGGSLSSKGGKTMEALAASRKHLASATNTNSALAAKAGWDQGFGLKHTGAGGGGQLSSYNKAAASLDHIETGEVGSLKIGDPNSLSVPDVGKPKAVEGAETAGDKAKDAMKKNMADQIAQSIMSSLASGLAPKSQQQSPDQKEDMPDDMRNWIDEQLALGSGELDGYVDTDYDYKGITCQSNCPAGVEPGQQYFNVKFNGQGDNSGLNNNCVVIPKPGGGYDANCF